MVRSKARWDSEVVAGGVWLSPVRHLVLTCCCNSQLVTHAWLTSHLASATSRRHNCQLCKNHQKTNVCSAYHNKHSPSPGLLSETVVLVFVKEKKETKMVFNLSPWRKLLRSYVLSSNKGLCLRDTISSYRGSHITITVSSKLIMQRAPSLESFR